MRLVWHEVGGAGAGDVARLADDGRENGVGAKGGGGAAEVVGVC